MVQRKAQQHTQHARAQADQHELEGVGAGHAALRQAEHAQHGAVVQVAGREAARGQRHGHGRQQRREQRDQAQEFLGAVQRLAHLGPAALEGVEPHAAQLALLDGGVGPFGEALHGGVVARHGVAVAHAAGRLHEAGARHVGLVEHHARRKAHEARAPVGLQRDHAAHAQAGVAQQQRVADLQAQRVEQRGIDPDLARRRHVARHRARALGRGRRLQVAAQRVARRHGLQGHELAGAALGVLGPRHGGKAEGAGARKAQRLRLCDESFGRRVVAHDHRVAAQQLARIALQPALQSVGEEADRRERGHGQHHGHDQEAQLAGAQVAPERAPAKAKGSVHGANDSRRLPAPADSRVIE
ncbi:hypothetical protein D3C72_1397060 [compost metagenome]